MTHSKIIKYLIFFTLAFSLVSCSKDQEILRAYPLLQTLEVSNISDSGANFKAKIENNYHEIIEYGFVWDVSENPTIEYANKKVFTKKLTNNEFSSEITTTLFKNRKYFVRAYVKTSGYLVYGKNVSFKSLGSGSATLSSFFPKIGTWGDTINIKGKNFSFKKEYNRVIFKDIESRVISNTDTTLTCIVPRNISDKSVPLYVKVLNESVKFQENFNLLSPEIISISPLNATFGDEITIIGKNFSRESFDTHVFFGNVEATLISSNENSIKVIVPDNLESSSEPIKVVSNLQEVTYSNNFTLKSPIITFATQEVNADKTINIKVSNYHPITSKNLFTIENNNANIISGDAGDYIVHVPWGPFPRRKAKIKIQILDLTAEYQLDVTIKDKWIMVNNNLPFRYDLSSVNNAVVTQGIAYVLAQSNNLSDHKIYIWKFNQTDFTWEKKNTPFTTNSINKGPIAESNGEKIYIYLKDNNDFWEYNPTSDLWSKKSSFIGKERDGATHFSIGEDIYIGLGTDYISYVSIPYVDFYKYNPTSDLWTRVSDVPFNYYAERSNTASFVINNIGYFTGGGYTTGDVDSWSYNPVTDTWLRIADNLNSIIFNHNPGTSLNGYGYVAGIGWNNAESLRYDPVKNIWEQSYNIGKSRYNNFIFSLNGKMYIGGGSSHHDILVESELFEFVP